MPRVDVARREGAPAGAGHFPAVFVSHGAPTLPFDPGPTPGFLRGLGARLGRPRAIVCVSAHWEAATPCVSLAPRPATIHDFHGFPERLYEIRYPAPGDPALGTRVLELLRGAGIGAESDPSRGLDHGAWVPLLLMYPDAAVPVLQVSVQPGLAARDHLAIGRALRPLRGEGILILGSGGATHNLREFGRHAIDAPPAAYALAFDDWLHDAVEGGRVDEIADYLARAPEARRNHPTPDHFLPLLVTLGSSAPGASGRRVHAAFTFGVFSMAAFEWAD